MLDTCFNEVLYVEFERNVFTSSKVIKVLNKVLSQRQIQESEEPTLILHSDRGTQFTSKLYNQFVQENEKKFLPSMSPCASPKSNAIAERFMRTLKTYKFTSPKNFNGEKNLDEFFASKYLEDLSDKQMRSVISDLIDVYNSSSTKKAKLGASQETALFNIGATQCEEPPYDQAYSERVHLNDHRRLGIETHKINTVELGLLMESTVMSPEERENINLKLNFINNAVKEMSRNIKEQKTDNQDNQDEVRTMFNTQNIAFSHLYQTVLEIKDEVEKKNLKREKKQMKKLRQPIYYQQYTIFMATAGSQIMRNKRCRESQLRIIYTLLYYLGLRLNELKEISYDNVITLIQTGTLDVILYKTRTTVKKVITKEGRQQLVTLRPDIENFFKRNQNDTLGTDGTNNLIENVSFIRFVNFDMKFTCERFQIEFNEEYSSHCFRIGYITKLLHVAAPHQVAEMVGHKSIASTLRYNRYDLTVKDQIDFLNEAEKIYLVFNRKIITIITQ